LPKELSPVHIDIPIQTSLYIPPPPGSQPLRVRVETYLRYRLWDKSKKHALETNRSALSRNRTHSHLENFKEFANFLRLIYVDLQVLCLGKAHVDYELEVGDVLVVPPALQVPTMACYRILSPQVYYLDKEGVKRKVKKNFPAFTIRKKPLDYQAQHS
jgi:hypothetical protein